MEAPGLNETFERESTLLDRALGTVKEAMTREVVTVTPSMKGTDALRRLEMARVSGAPVLEHGRVVGMFTMSDSPTPGALVGEVMSRDVVTADPEWSLTQAATIMEAVGVNRLPVVDALDRPVGILTRDDIVRAVARRAQLAGRTDFTSGDRIIQLP